MLENAKIFLVVVAGLFAAIWIIRSRRRIAQTKRNEAIKEQESMVLDNPEKFSAKIVGRDERYSQNSKLIQLHVIIPKDFKYKIAVEDVPDHRTWEPTRSIFEDDFNAGLKIIKNWIRVSNHKDLIFHIEAIGKQASRVINIPCNT